MVIVVYILYFNGEVYALLGKRFLEERLLRRVVRQQLEAHNVAKSLRTITYVVVEKAAQLSGTDTGI